MTVTVTRIDGHLAVEWPGASGLLIAANLEVGLIVIICPNCGERSERYLVDGDDFEITHQPDCRHERIIRRLVSQHPERLGERPSDLRVHVGDCVLVVRDSMPLRGPEDLYHDAEVTRGKRSRASAKRRRRRTTGRRRRKRRCH